MKGDIKGGNIYYIGIGFEVFHSGDYEGYYLLGCDGM
jgi:hypothetical protein